MKNQIREKAEQAFKNHLTYLSTGRIEEWVNLFAEEGVLEFPYGPDGFPKKVAGKEALYEYMKNFPEHFKVAFTNLYFHPTADPTLVIAEFESDGIALSTGRPYLQKYISVVNNTEDGKITRYVDFWNPLVAMKSMNVPIDALTEAFSS